jgi:hypothetical protein
MDRNEIMYLHAATATGYHLQTHRESFSRTYPPAPAIKSPLPPHSPTFCLPPAFSPPRPRPAFPRPTTRRYAAPSASVRRTVSPGASQQPGHAAMWWRCVMVFLHDGGEGDGELGAGSWDERAWTVDAGTLGRTEYSVFGARDIRHMASLVLAAPAYECAAEWWS